MHIFNTVDTHTAGEPTRVVVSGVPFLQGTMSEKRRRLQQRYDFIGTTLMHEPRGHADMFGAIIMEPAHPEADIGVVFMDGGGYLAMCGHGSIGVGGEPGAAVELAHLPELIRRGRAILAAIAEQIDVVHPTQPHIDTVDLVEI